MMQPTSPPPAAFTCPWCNAPASPAPGPQACSGLAPIDQVGVAWPDVVSVAVWRKLGWVDCLIGALVPLPISLLCLWVAILAIPKAPGVAGTFGVIAVVFGLVAAYMFRRGAVTGKRQMRIVGRHGSMTVPFSESPAASSDAPVPR